MAASSTLPVLRPGEQHDGLTVRSASVAWTGQGAANAWPVQPGLAVGLQQDSLAGRTVTTAWATEGDDKLKARYCRDARQPLPPVDYEDSRLAATAVHASPRLALQAALWTREQFLDYLVLPGSFQALHGSGISVQKLWDKLVGEQQWQKLPGGKWVATGWNVEAGAATESISLD